MPGDSKLVFWKVVLPELADIARQVLDLLNQSDLGWVYFYNKYSKSQGLSLSTGTKIPLKIQEGPHEIYLVNRVITPETKIVLRAVGPLPDRPVVVIKGILERALARLLDQSPPDCRMSFAAFNHNGLDGNADIYNIIYDIQL